MPCLDLHMHCTITASAVLRILSMPPGWLLLTDITPDTRTLLSFSTLITIKCPSHNFPDYYNEHRCSVHHVNDGTCERHGGLSKPARGSAFRLPCTGSHRGENEDIDALVRQPQAHGRRLLYRACAILKLARKAACSSFRYLQCSIIPIVDSRCSQTEQSRDASIDGSDWPVHGRCLDLHPPFPTSSRIYHSTLVFISSTFL
ncbi:hypothetical protein BD414DRAFT_494833 [Trametes punicea]|nr:hypothetical protein BD414DRAFT_494833 [Trametes punicea]